MRKKPSMYEVYKQFYEEHKNDPKYKKETYTKRAAAPYIILYGTIFSSLAYVMSKEFGITSYVTCIVALSVTIPLAFYSAQKKADKKFGDK